MSKSDTMHIAFPNGGILPASVTGGKETSVPPHEAVKVPRTYGEHLVHDRFAYEAEAPKARKKAGPTPDTLIADLETQIEHKRKALEDEPDAERRASIEKEIAFHEDQLAGLKG